MTKTQVTLFDFYLKNDGYIFLSSKFFFFFFVICVLKQMQSKKKESININFPLEKSNLLNDIDKKNDKISNVFDGLGNNIKKVASPPMAPINSMMSLPNLNFDLSQALMKTQLIHSESAPPNDPMLPSSCARYDILPMGMKNLAPKMLRECDDPPIPPHFGSFPLLLTPGSSVPKQTDSRKNNLQLFGLVGMTDIHRDSGETEKMMNQSKTNKTNGNSEAELVANKRTIFPWNNHNFAHVNKQENGSADLHLAIEKEKKNTIVNNPQIFELNANQSKSSMPKAKKDILTNESKSMTTTQEKAYSMDSSESNENASNLSLLPASMIEEELAKIMDDESKNNQSYEKMFEQMQEKQILKRKIHEQLEAWKYFLENWRKWYIDDLHAYLIRIDDQQFARYFPTVDDLKTRWAKEHSQPFKGDDLMNLDREDLFVLGVTDRNDRQTIANRIRDLCTGNLFQNKN
ncbi:hypothetical protein RFI_09119 [Reticulomyxa filosa]|uniref:SAM domain-containing protein n=1 Tax=Reticulomyxa filosa TaxID=46433 RepID=X6NQN8_RETFI|nr:hypothetical protein RFI_09119 [Reticulomyxa filosa]|eukprot:ETO28014.1 hypothetical protein RFI_09119 [Reticulomyxa filosa]